MGTERKNASFIFRAAAGPRVGSGHVMRCRSLGKALRESGAKCLFLTADVAAPATDKERELSAFFSVLAKEKPDAVILDSYDVTAAGMQSLRDAAPLVYFDDLAAFPYPADVLVNYNLYAREETYRALYEGSGVPFPGRCFFGPAYTPLRPEFADCGPRSFTGVHDVLVTSGGADPEEILPDILRLILGGPALSGVRFHILVGASAEAAGEGKVLRDLAEGRDGIRILSQTDDMRTLIRSCDLAVSAAGSTLHELCACGTPAVSFVTADNQRENAAAFEEAGLMACAGDCRDRKRFLETLEELLSEAEKYDGDALLLRSERMRRTEDGKGARRLAAGLLEFVSRSRNGAAGGVWNGSEGGTRDGGNGGAE